MISRALNILDGMVQKMETGQRIEISDAFAILKFLEIFVDEYHEHSEERTAKACIEDALNAKAGKEFVRSARDLSRLLRSGFPSEDAIAAKFRNSLLYPNFAYLERKYVSEFRNRARDPQRAHLNDMR
jgi:hypothetical protein